MRPLMARLPGGSYWRWGALAMVASLVVATIRDPEPAWAYVVVGLVMLPLVARMARVAVFADDECLLARNVFTTRRIRYSEIDEIVTASYWWTREQSGSLRCTVGEAKFRLSGTICYSAVAVQHVAAAYESLGASHGVVVSIDRDELRSRWL
jgi:hypothetical protein